MAIDRDELIKLIEANFPNLNLRTTEEFYGQTGGIWVSGTEDGIEAKDGFPLFNYFTLDHHQVRYFNGVHKDLRNLVDDSGWFCEWNDPGTCMIWEA